MMACTDITPSLRETVLARWGERGRKALDAVDKGQVKKYLDFFVVVGRTDEYVVEDDFCTCGDFTFRGRTCWHILAVRIARKTGRFEEYQLWYQDTWCGSD